MVPKLIANIYIYWTWFFYIILYCLWAEFITHFSHHFRLAIVSFEKNIMCWNCIPACLPLISCAYAFTNWTVTIPIVASIKIYRACSMLGRRSLLHTSYPLSSEVYILSSNNFIIMVLIPWHHLILLLFPTCHFAWH